MSAPTYALRPGTGRRAATPPASAAAIAAKERCVGAFRERLAALQPRSTAAEDRDRRWILVPYDQLHDRIGPLSREPAEQLGIVVVESRAKAARRPYHRHKLALVLANLRHFALEQAERGVRVRHVAGDASYAELLRPVVAETGMLRVMRPAERELRHDLAPLLADGLLEELPHEGWLTTADDFAALGDPPWRMDSFYRRVRKRTGILMDADGGPEGGKFSFDADNRQPWHGEPAPPDEPTFPRDAIKDEVVALVEQQFADHPGEIRPDHLPATRADAAALWRWARRECLPTFGPYEDAMTARSTGLFHTRLSPLLNLCRLLPRDVLHGALELDLPLPSKEGFVRQLLGWREFVHHVHEATDGLRETPHGSNFLGAELDLPPVFWGDAPSGMRCLDAVVGDVWREAYSHHITRLMVLGNTATLLDVDPRQLTDWFWVAYADAYDWVVEPNVLAMGSYATGPLMTTKPYVAGSGYVHRMSDYCGDCAFHPKRSCPLTRLYWAFLDRHRPLLDGNQRLAMPMRTLDKRDAADRRRDARVFDYARERLAAGRPLAVDEVEAILSRPRSKR